MELFQIDEDYDACLEAARGLLKARGYKNKWLNVRQIAYGPKYASRGQAKVENPILRELCATIYREIWQPRLVTPNIVYIQYTNPNGVARHRDPISDKEFTTITYLGDFTGGEFCTDTAEFAVRPGDTLLVPTTVRGIQGPWHWTKPHIGERYTIILNYNESR